MAGGGAASSFFWQMDTALSAHEQADGKRSHDSSEEDKS